MEDQAGGARLTQESRLRLSPEAVLATGVTNLQIGFGALGGINCGEVCCQHLWQTVSAYHIISCVLTCFVLCFLLLLFF